MGDNPEQQLTEKTKHCQKTGRNSSALRMQKSTETTGDSEHSVEQSPLVDDVTKQLKDIDLALDSDQQQLKLSREQYSCTQPALSTSADRSTIQSDDNQMQIAKVTINQHVKQSNDNNDQNEAKLNTTAPEPQALSNGTLPDDIYTLLMSVMGIQECLLSNRLVCLLWNDLVLERCNNQKSLKLFETFDNLMKYGEDLLLFGKTDDASLILKSIGDDLLFEALSTDHEELVNSLNPEIILTREKKLEASKVITTLFSKVEELVLCTEENTLIDIEHLLQFYAGQLTSLSMTGYTLSERLGSKLRASNFPKLKALNAFEFRPEDEQLLSLLPQLESLSLMDTEICLETLLRTGTQLQELSLCFIHFVFAEPVDEFSKRPRISNQLRKFAFCDSQSELNSDNEVQVLEFISVHLTSLECLEVEFGCEVGPLSSVTSYLEPLHRLHSLTLTSSVSSFLLADNQLAEVQPLPSVRHLKLLLRGSYAALSNDLLSRALFTAFPKVEQIGIAFFGTEDTGTIAAYEEFAGKHPNVVQLFRSKTLSKCTNWPNIVSPLLGRHRQMYEEYIAEEELFGVALCKLAACLVPRQGEEDVPNLKITLRPADRLAAMSNLLQLLERKAFTFSESNWRISRMMESRMLKCARKCDPSEGELFTIICKCILFLLDCNPLEEHYEDCARWPFHCMLKLVEHYEKQQFEKEDLLLQIHNSMDKLVEGALHTSQFDGVIKENLRDQNQVYRVETARALLRVYQSAP